jgi:hypothetical protein
MFVGGLFQVKRNLETALSHWDDFDRLYQQLTEWVGDVERRLATDPEYKTDLPEKRSSLEKYKVWVDNEESFEQWAVVQNLLWQIVCACISPRAFV